MCEGLFNYGNVLFMIQRKQCWKALWGQWHLSMHEFPVMDEKEVENNTKGEADGLF